MRLVRIVGINFGEFWGELVEVLEANSEEFWYRFRKVPESFIGWAD